MCKNHPQTQEVARPVCSLTHKTSFWHQVPLAATASTCWSSQLLSREEFVSVTLENTKSGGETWSAGALECMDHVFTNAFTSLGQPEVQAVQEQGPKGAEIHLADTCIYRKKEEKQDVPLEEVLLQKAADECR